MKRYKCRTCDLFFSVEEIPELYSYGGKICVRCLIVRKNELGKVTLPSCFGVGYDGADQLCTRHCLVSKGCMIHFIDQRAVDWSFDFESQFKQKKVTTHEQRVVRILRALGQPIHLKDLGPILEKISEGKFSTARKTWKQQLLKILSIRPDVVNLGESFFVWAGIWNPATDSGEVGYRQKNKVIQLTPVQEIFDQE